MIDSIKQALEKATQGPWVIGDIPQGDQYLKSVTNKVGIVGGCLLTEDAQLIANAPEWLRYLIGEVDELQKALENIATGNYGSSDCKKFANQALERSKSQ